MTTHSINKIVLLLLLLLTLYACRTHSYPVIQTKSKQLAEFRKTLEKIKDQQKDYWDTLVNGRWDFFKKCYNTTLSEKDVPNLTFVAIPVYSIDHKTCRNFMEGKGKVKNLTLDTMRAMFLIIKDSLIVGQYSAMFRSDKWQTGDGYSGFTSGAAKILNLLYSQGINLYVVNIYLSLNSLYYHFQALAYDNNKDIIVIGNGNKMTLNQYLEDVKAGKY
jgi:hypothetical protein